MRSGFIFFSGTGKSVYLRRVACCRKPCGLLTAFALQQTRSIKLCFVQASFEVVSQPDGCLSSLPFGKLARLLRLVQAAFQIMSQALRLAYRVCLSANSLDKTMLCSSGFPNHPSRQTILLEDVCRILDSGFRGCLCIP